MPGTITRLNERGYGFIKTEQEGDLFFHRSVLEGVEFNNLNMGQEVEFEMGQDSKGRKQAVKVMLTETQASDDGGDDQSESEDEA